jgi:hypothetical protein
VKEKESPQKAIQNLLKSQGRPTSQGEHPAILGTNIPQFDGPHEKSRVGSLQDES